MRFLVYSNRLHIVVSTRFLKALSRDGETKVVQDAPASSAPAAVAVTSPGPAKKLSKKEQKALKQAAAAAASSAPATTTTTPTAAASTTVTAKTTTMTTTATTGTTTKAAAAEAPTSAVAGKKRRASDANASPAKEGEGNQKTDVVVKQKQKEQGPAAKKVKGQDGTAQPAAESKESKESKESEESREKPKEKKEKKPEVRTREQGRTYARVSRHTLTHWLARPVRQIASP
jgi:hypothetical protein